jgi:hypothetical protein
MTRAPSQTLLGLIAGIAWGLVLGYFFKSEDATGPALVVLLGPPVVLLICPERPLLSWQAPVVTAAVFGTIMTRNRGDTGSGGPVDTPGSLLLTALLPWLMLSLLSSPWAIIFQQRARKKLEGVKGSTEPSASRVGVTLLVFLACALVLLGFALAMVPIDSADPHDRLVHFYGLLMAAAGVAMSVGTYRIAHKLGIGERVKDVLELPLILGAVVAGLFLLASCIMLFLPGSSQFPRQALSSGGISCVLAVMEAAAGLIWLARTGKRIARSGS